MDWLPFSTDFHGTTAWVTANTHHPYCKATSVEVLRSQVITVTLAREPEVVTTTTQLADDATLFAEAAMFRATVYSELGGSSTCWGKSCPYTWTPTYTYPSTITPTPTLHYTPPASCVDPDNLWVVTTSCYLTAPTQIFRGGGNQTPDWLACTPTMVGAPGWYLRAPCSMPLSTVQEADTLYYSGCPSGYTAISTGSSQGWYDTSRYNSGCAYSFTTGPTNEGQSTTTVHDGMTYGLFVYPLPRCYATSVDALSGKEVPMHTTSDTMAWDKRQEGDAWPTTVSWDYARGTVWAQAQYAGYTVLMGTHTCYESCSTWLDYYYPDRTGGATPATATTVQPSSTSTGDASSEGPADSTTTSSGANGTSPTQIETSGAVVGSVGTRLYHIAGFLFFILVFLNS
ncbi:hypothetical protein TruAng_004730 [Truncatella angustata]|nr:hypothetical protein TruAng_004730 [Truncatella angustata]